MKKEEFWFIAAITSEDETEIRPWKAPAEPIRTFGADAPAVLGGREDPYRAGMNTGEENISEHCRRKGIVSSI
ncbi:hypothetical protein LPJ38_01875 [Bradyrhizobium daqingense]|uniref:hypothetical protein n=1 Tax=Bradyrhizobium daqingense TaxID=993502 RepID=UPI0011A845CA|nr:hypothetical protein [Bradyrhizobium daqingense]UFS89559.1 hypothetical protein LPJ38_01875 [Bradyrhizobium daqingense]